MAKQTNTQHKPIKLLIVNSQTTHTSQQSLLMDHNRLRKSRVWNNEKPVHGFWLQLHTCL